MTRSNGGVLLAEPVQGEQQPRVLSRPPWTSSAGDEALDLARSVGVNLDPWQELEVLIILAESANGNWAAFETALLVARQNGKGEIILVLELAGLFLLGEMLLLHSAHEFKTSKEAYLRIKSVIEGAPHLSRLVKQFRQSNEDTSVELQSGARLRFMARSRQTGRGFSAQRLLVDEAQILSHASMGALMPTLSAQANPQINYFFTVPRGADTSEHVEGLQVRGRQGGDPFLLWAEHSIDPSAPLADIDLDDRSLWIQANPATGFRMGLDFTAKERASLSDEDFAAERLSYWPDVKAANGPRWKTVTEAEWSARAAVDPPEQGWLSGTVAFAAEVSDDRTSSHVAVAGSTPEGIGADVIASSAGTAWVVPHLVEIGATSVVIDPRSNAASLIDACTEAGIAVTECSTSDLMKATGALLDEIREGGFEHRGNPILTAAAASAVLRKYGESRLIDRLATGDPTPFIAVVLARWGHLQAPEPVTADHLMY